MEVTMKENTHRIAVTQRESEYTGRAGELTGD